MTREDEDNLIIELLEKNPSYYDPNPEHTPLVFDKNGRRLSYEEIMEMVSEEDG